MLHVHLSILLSIGLRDDRVMLVPGLAHAIPLDPLWADVCEVIHHQIEETATLPSGVSPHLQDGAAGTQPAPAAPIELTQKVELPKKERKGDVVEAKDVLYTESTVMLPGDIELFSFLPRNVADVKPLPVLFIHSEISGAWVWKENFLPYFASEGMSVLLVFYVR